jgi:hypothetical protein
MSNIERNRVSRFHVAMLHLTGAASIVSTLLFGSQIIGAHEAKADITQQHEWNDKREAAAVRRAQESEKVPVGYTANGVSVAEKVRIVSYPNRPIEVLEARADSKKQRADEFGWTTLGSLASLAFAGVSALTSGRRRRYEDADRHAADQAAADFVPPTRGASMTWQPVASEALTEVASATATTILGNLGLTVRPDAEHSVCAAPALGAPHVVTGEAVDPTLQRTYAGQRYGSLHRRDEMSTFGQMMETYTLSRREIRRVQRVAGAITDRYGEPPTVIWPDEQGSTAWAAELDARDASAPTAPYQPFDSVSYAELPSLR